MHTNPPTRSLLILGFLALGVGVYLATGTVETSETIAAPLSQPTPSSQAVPIEASGAPSPARKIENSGETTPTGSPEPVLQIQTIDEFGQAVSGAQVYSILETQRTLLGETDALGALEILLPSSKTLGLLATRPGYASAGIPAPEFTGPEEDTPWKQRTLELTLRTDSGALTGQVFFPSGLPVGAGCIVVAVEHENHGPTARATVSKAGRGIPIPERALTDEEGRFVLPDLRADREWDLYARIGSYATALAAESRIGEPCTIQLAKVFAMRLLARDAQGNPLVTSPYVGGHYRNSSSWVDSDLPHQYMFPLYGVTPLIFGLDSNRTWLASPWEANHMYAVAGDPETFGPIRGNFAITGYHMQDYEIMLPPLVDSTIPEKLITLEADTDEWGTLIVKFGPGLPRAGKDLHTSRKPAFTVVFKHIARDQIYTAEVLPLDEPLILEVIPAGEYIIKTILPDAWPEFGPDDQRITVGAQPVTCTLNLSEYGFLDVRHITDGGEEFNGSVWLKVIDAATKGAVRRLHFDQGPYAMVLPSPGEYEVQMTFDRLSKQGPVGSVAISSGALNEVLVR